MPCDVVARVTPPEALAPVTARASWLGGRRIKPRLATEVEVAKRLAENDSPVAGLDPTRSSHASLCMMALQSPCGPTLHLFAGMLPPLTADYAQALEASSCRRGPAADRQRSRRRTSWIAWRRPGTTLRAVNVTPDLAEADRALLASTLRDLSESIVGKPARGRAAPARRAAPRNVLFETKNGPLFMDFEDSVRWPHWSGLPRWVPKEVSERAIRARTQHWSGSSRVVLAIIAAHRWSRDDQHPGGDNPEWHSSTLCARVRPGLRTMPCSLSWLTILAPRLTRGLDLHVHRPRGPKSLH